jgi:hypothetical protein
MPTVSLITPSTPQRHSQFGKRLEYCVKSQMYGNIVEHLVCYDDLTIGEKRNILCEQAKGEIIVMFDSDDFYRMDYVTNAVNRLMECDTTGKNRCLYFKADDKTYYTYTAAISQPYVIGSGMAFWKRVWEKNRFLNIQVGEDTAFCGNAGVIKPSEIVSDFIAVIHGGNTSSNWNRLKRSLVAETDFNQTTFPETFSQFNQYLSL